jgi:hypothetical protein
VDRTSGPTGHLGNLQLNYPSLPSLSGAVRGDRYDDGVRTVTSGSVWNIDISFPGGCPSGQDAVSVVVPRWVVDASGAVPSSRRVQTLALKAILQM